MSDRWVFVRPGVWRLREPIDREAARQLMRDRLEAPRRSEEERARLEAGGILLLCCLGLLPVAWEIPAALVVVTLTGGLVVIGLLFNWMSTGRQRRHH